MNPETLAITMFFTLFVGLMLGHPLAFTLGMLAVVFGVIGWGGSADAVFALLANRAYGVMEEYVLVAVPLFIFMAQILDASGIAERLFETMHIVMGRIRGEVSVGLLAIPALMRVKYNIPLVAGCICAGGTLGILIPPSIMLVVYGSLTQISVGWLYAAAFGPGFLLSSLYIAYIAIICFIRPEFGPAETESRHSTVEKISMFSRSIVPPVVLVFIVLGSIVAGIATPTEAAGMGCAGAIVLAVGYRKFSWKMLKDACWTTTLTTSMIMTLFLGGNAFQAIFMGLGGGDAIANFILGTQLSPIAVLFLMMGIVFFLGCFLDWLGILLIVTPIFMPVSMELGFNQLWFGTLICVNLQMAFLTPPFGYSLFYLKGIAPPEMTIYHIYKGVVPFVCLQWLALILCIFVPDIVMWAPAKFFGPSVLG
jgi:tripartite ATP-independent transporter DctM subunit